MGLLSDFLGFASKAAPAVSAVGTAISFLGVGRESDEQEEALRLRQRAYATNAENIRLQSEAERFKVGFQTKADITDLKRAAFKQIGAVHAAVGASGITTSGSVLDVIEESAYLASIDIARRETQGKFETDAISRNEKILITEEKQKAAAAGVAADNVGDSKLFKQASTVLNGVGDIARFG